MRLPPATYSLSKSDKYAKNAMEIVHEPKYVGSNNLEICLACMMQFSTPLSITKKNNPVLTRLLGFVTCYHIDKKVPLPSWNRVKATLPDFNLELHRASEKGEIGAWCMTRSFLRVCVCNFLPNQEATRFDAEYVQCKL